MRKKAKGSKTPTDRERIETLERQLDAACREHRRLKDEVRALEARDPLDGLRKALRKQTRRNPPGGWPRPFNADVDPDESVN